MSPSRQVAVRVAQAVPLLLATSALSFVLLRLAPGDPARLLAGPRASEQAVAGLRADMGLDDPVLLQYWRYLHRVGTGHWGTNLTGNADVVDLVLCGAVTTGLLSAAAMLLAVGTAVPVALAAAHRPGGRLDRAVRWVSVTGLAVPSFWLGVLLITFVALPTGWFPVGGWPDGAGARAQALVLPAVTLAIGVTPVLLRSMRSAFLDVLSADHVTAARVLGVSRGRVLTRFVLRNAAAPVIPVLAFLVTYVIGGSVVVESTFNLPGLGQTLVQAALTRDANVLQALTLVLGTTVVLVHLVADLVGARADPRGAAR